MLDAHDEENKYYLDAEKLIRSLCEKNSDKKRLNISVDKISALINQRSIVVRQNNVPDRLETYFESITWKKYYGLYVKIEECIDEHEDVVEKRKQRRKDERLEDIRESTVNVGDVLE